MARSVIGCLTSACSRRAVIWWSRAFACDIFFHGRSRLKRDVRRLNTMRHVKTEKQLGQALREDAERIEIEGDLARKVIRIRATGKVSWAVCIACCSVAITLIVLGPTPEKAAILAPAAGILGLPAAIAAISIGFAAGGVAALTKLRRYREISRTSETLVLERR